MKARQMILLWHRLGFHGPNWHSFWLDGNMWIECVVCGARRMPSFEDVSEMPSEEIAKVASHSRFSYDC